MGGGRGVLVRPGAAVAGLLWMMAAGLLSYDLAVGQMTLAGRWGVVVTVLAASMTVVCTLRSSMRLVVDEFRQAQVDRINDRVRR